ncbi:MAG: hypothetical protein FIA94_02815 [Nitrospirae bacterium]|nr:hypothetical protein [Nitrospirota bacterium]
MKRYIIVLLIVACFVLPSFAHAIESLPGSTWGDLHAEFPDSGGSNAILEGWIRQGIGWKKWEKGSTSFLLNTYLTARYKWDSEGLDWNNYIGPGFGAAIEMSNPHGPLVSWGAEYIHEYDYRSNDENPYTALYMNWYHWWDLEGTKYPGSTWGDLRYEIPNGGDSNLILEGWIRQGITWKRWEREGRTYILNPYLKVKYKWDSEGLDWNNYISPGAGVALDMESPKGPLLSWGVEYSWENDFRSGDDVHKVEVFMRWYAWWDLKHKESK